jgi:molybdopterin-guanine dinucleotide biosynthesis protein
MIIVVGGSGRKAGKTLLAERLIRAFPEARWLAVKISRHAHGAAGWSLDRQEAPDPASDSGRFLAAGACQAWWLRAEPERLAEAVPELQRLMARFENVILESNSIAAHIRPDIYLFVDSGKVTVKRMPPGG